MRAVQNQHKQPKSSSLKPTICLRCPPALPKLRAHRGAQVRQARSVGRIAAAAARRRLVGPRAGVGLRARQCRRRRRGVRCAPMQHLHGRARHCARTSLKFMRARAQCRPGLNWGFLSHMFVQVRLQARPNTCIVIFVMGSQQYTQSCHVLGKQCRCDIKIRNSAEQLPRRAEHPCA